LYPQTVAIAERTSIDWARVVRGMRSTASAETPLGDVLRRARGFERAKKTDEYLVTAQEREIELPGAIVGAVAEDLDQRVRRREHARPIRQAPSTLLQVFGVGISRRDARPGLDHDLVARADDAGQHGWNERHSALAGIRLLGDADDHGPFNLRGVPCSAHDAGAQAVRHLSTNRAIRSAAGADLVYLRLPRPGTRGVLCKRGNPDRCLSYR
jgi:hypothetical protein